MSVNKPIFTARSEIVLGIGHQSYRQLCSDSPRPMSADYVVLTQLDLGESNALCFSLSSPLAPLKRLRHRVNDVFKGGLKWKFNTDITICSKNFVALELAIQYNCVCSISASPLTRQSQRPQIPNLHILLPRSVAVL